MKKTIFIAILASHLQLVAAGFQFYPQNNIMTGELEIFKTNVMLNETSSHSCLFDTGARYTIFKEASAKDLPKIGETIGGGISNVSNVIDLVEANLNLGDFRLQKTKIGRTNHIPFDCIIGNDFLLGRIIEINFNSNQVIELPSMSKPNLLLPVHLYQNDEGGHFGFEMVLANKTIETLFDTGANSTVVSLDFVQKNISHFKLIKEIQVTDGNNASIKAGLYTLDQIQFGNAVLKNIQVYALDLKNLQTKLPKVQIILGLNVIKNYNWQFDLVNGGYNFNAINSTK